jgi:hypothetical protein
MSEDATDPDRLLYLGIAISQKRMTDLWFRSLGPVINHRVTPAQADPARNL